MDTSATAVEQQRQRLLQALQALPAVGIGVDKPLLRKVEEEDPDSWDMDTWHFANGRDMLTPAQKARYSMLVLEEQQKAERDALLAYQGGNIPGLGVATRDGVSTADMPPPVAGVPASSRVAVQEAGGPEEGPEEEPPYEQWTKADLQGEVTARNEGRDDVNKVRPASDRKDDLVAALYRDDQENPA